MTAYRKPGSAFPSIAGFAVALAIALFGIVALFRSTNAEEGDPPPTLLGLPMQSEWPGIVLLLAALGLAVWAFRAWHSTGRLAPRTEVTSWVAQPPTGVKYFGNPPAAPSRRAELAAQGIEAFPKGNGEWGLRRIGR